jgi:hypothetical protein
MKKFAYSAFTAVAALALSACGSSDGANEEAAPDNVEMPAEEAMSNVDATPAADASAAASDAAAAASGAVPADAAASTVASTAATDAAKAAEDATKAAEKKM